MRTTRSSRKRSERQPAGWRPRRYCYRRRSPAPFCDPSPPPLSPLPAADTVTWAAKTFLGRGQEIHLVQVRLRGRHSEPAVCATVCWRLRPRPHAWPTPRLSSLPFTSSLLAPGAGQHAGQPGGRKHGRGRHLRQHPGGFAGETDVRPGRPPAPAPCALRPAAAVMCHCACSTARRVTRASLAQLKCT